MLKTNSKNINLKIKEEVEKYLKEINFDERLKRGEYFTNKEFRKIMIKNLEEYFQGKKTQDFLIELGAVFYPEMITSIDEKDDPLMTSLCILDDLSFGYKSLSSRKKVDWILQNILKLLTNKISLKRFLEMVEG